MYLHPITHKDKEDAVLMAQLNGWVFESHCWVDAGGRHPQTCRYCGATTKRDMLQKGGNKLCTKNPALEPILTGLLGTVSILDERISMTEGKQKIVTSQAASALKRLGLY